MTRYHHHKTLAVTSVAFFRSPVLLVTLFTSAAFFGSFKSTPVVFPTSPTGVFLTTSSSSLVSLASFFLEMFSFLGVLFSLGVPLASFGTPFSLPGLP